MEPAPIIIREYAAEDRSYILDSGWRSILDASPYAQGATPQQLSDALDRLLMKWHCRVACASGEASTIFGWIIYAVPNTVAWLYVRQDWRSRGIARSLLDYARVSAPTKQLVFMPSHSTLLKWQAHGHAFRFRPHLALP